MSTLDRERILDVIVDVLGAIAPEIERSAVKPDEPLREQIDLDSFDFLNVIIALHERLGIDIPESDYARLGTLNSMIEYLTRRVLGTAA